MKINEEGINLIKEFEGRILDKATGLHKAYICPAGYWTVGYGHLIIGPNGLPLSNIPGKKYGGKEITLLNFNQIPDNYRLIDEATALSYLKTELDYFSTKVADLVTSNLNSNQFSAIVSFCYNCGEGNFKRSSLRSLINTNPDDKGIEYQFSRWNQGGGKVLPGLTRRRKAEYALYCKPEMADVAHSTIKEQMICKAQDSSVLDYICKLFKIKS